MRCVSLFALLVLSSVSSAAPPHLFQDWEEVKVWDAILSYEGNRLSLESMDVSPDGTTMALTGQVRDRGAMYSWTLPVYERGDEPQLLGAYAGGRIRAFSTLFTSDGERVVVLDASQHRVHVHRFPSGEEELSFFAEGSHLPLVLFPEREQKDLVQYDAARHPEAAAILERLRYVTTGANGIFQLWDDEGALLTTLPGHTKEQERSWVFGLAFNPQGTVLASTGLNDSTVRLTSFVPESFGQQVILPGRFSAQSFPETYDEEGKALNRHGGGLRVVWSTDGATLAAAGGDGTVMVYRQNEADVFEWIGHFVAHQGYIMAIAFHPYSSNVLATGGDERKLCVWDLSPLPRKEPRLLKGIKAGRVSGGIVDMKFTLNGRALLAAVKGQGAVLYGGQDALTAPTQAELYRLKAIREGTLQSQ